MCDEFVASGIQVSELKAKLESGNAATRHVDARLTSAEHKASNKPDSAALPHSKETGPPTALPSAAPAPLDPETAKRRRQVRRAMAWAWKGYVDCGWGYDDAQPISCDGYNFVSMGATIVDSLDGLYMMGLTDEFERAAKWAINDLRFEADGVSVFETTIRVLGGLLSAFELTARREFLEKAKELGQKLVRAYDTRSKMPHAQISLRQPPSAGAGSGRSCIAEVASMQLEMNSLSYHTGDATFANVAMDAMKALLDIQRPRPHGVLPIDVVDGQFSGQQYSLGGRSDSAYEYFLKVAIQTGLKPLSDEADAILTDAIAVLLRKAGPRSYVGEAHGAGSVNPKMEHLACFSGGMYALGTIDFPQHNRVRDSKLRTKWLDIAAALAETCYQMYKQVIAYRL